MLKMKTKEHEADTMFLTQSKAEDSVRCLLRKWASSGGTADDSVTPTLGTAAVLDQVS